MLSNVLTHYLYKSLKVPEIAGVLYPKTSFKGVPLSDHMI